ncbi:MAG TPA: GNAT family N-acetyltransferase [Candidatus Binatia bacterium]|nr:GNAT family N-acetyltransferase [Candidatus Binatia bacterium]
MKTSIRIKRVASKKDLHAAFAIRRRVFVLEQGVPERIEIDGDDARAIHLLAFASGKPVGAARIVIQGATAKFGRMAVLKSYRGRGIGSALLIRTVKTARQNGAQTIYLHAQVTAIAFYQRMGFQPVGSTFEEAGILHRKMIYRSPDIL